MTTTATGSESILSLRGLGKTYGKRLLRRGGSRALDGVTLEVGRGTVFGLLGPNGAGKTTLIKILLGLLKRFDGTATVFGEPAGRTAPRQRIGYLPEAHRLPLYLTGRQVLRLFGQLCGRSRSWLDERIPHLLDVVQMTADADRKVREYSKGMQQRIGLAQALVHEPELVFLDEPTDGVDPIGRARIREVVQRMSDDGVTVFINSHLLMEVEMICDRVVIMDRGRIVREGTVDELTPLTGGVEFGLAEVPAGIEEVLAGLGTALTVRERGFEVFGLTEGQLDETVDRLRAASVSIRSIQPRRRNLEEAFIDVVTEGRKG